MIITGGIYNELTNDYLNDHLDKFSKEKEIFLLGNFRINFLSKGFIYQLMSSFNHVQCATLSPYTTAHKSNIVSIIS